MITDSPFPWSSGLRTHWRRNGFSLLEVVVAIGVFGFGIVVVIGLFAPLSRSIASNADAEAAVHLGDALKTELQARVSRSRSFAPVLALMRTEDDSQAAPVLFASRDGTRMGEREAAGWSGADEQRFFEIALSRMEPLSTTVSGEPTMILVYSAEIHWPVPTAGNTDGRQTVVINGAVRR